MERKRFEMNTRQDLKIIKISCEAAFIINQDSLNDKLSEIEDYTLLQSLIDHLGIKVRSGRNEMLDYGGRDYLVKRIDNKLVIWSVGFNGKNELGTGDDLVEFISISQTSPGSVPAPYR